MLKKINSSFIIAFVYFAGLLLSQQVCNLLTAKVDLILLTLYFADYILVPTAGLYLYSYLVKRKKNVLIGLSVFVVAMPILTFVDRYVERILVGRTELSAQFWQVVLFRSAVYVAVILLGIAFCEILKRIEKKSRKVAVATSISTIFALYSFLPCIVSLLISKALPFVDTQQIAIFIVFAIAIIIAICVVCVFYGLRKRSMLLLSIGVAIASMLQMSILFQAISYVLIVPALVIAALTFVFGCLAVSLSGHHNN